MNFFENIKKWLKNLLKINTVKKIDSPKEINNIKNIENDYKNIQNEFEKSLKVDLAKDNKVNYNTVKSITSKIETLQCVGDGLGIKSLKKY